MNARSTNQVFLAFLSTKKKIIGSPTMEADQISQSNILFPKLF